MNKKKRNLIIMLAATLILGGLLWLVVGSGNEDIDHTHSDTSSDDNTNTDGGILINENQEDLQNIVFSNDKAKYNVSLDTNAGQVIFDKLDGFPVNRTFMEYVWYGVAQMSYNNIITTTDSENYNEKDYGFNKPSLSVLATFSGNKKYEFIAGSSVPGAESDVYYVLLNGDKNVYACTIDIPFFMGDNYYLSDDIFYSYDKDIKEKSDIKIGDITLSGDNFKDDFIMKVNKESNLSNPFCGYGYVVTSPINWPVKVSSYSMLVHDLTYLTANDVVVLNPSNKQLKQYGLDSPSLTIEFERNGKACTLYGGNIVNNEMYVMLKGQQIIYMLDTETLSIIHNLTPENMYGGNALSISVETISEISIQTSDFSKKIEIVRSQKDSTASDDEIYTYSVNVNGEEKKYSVYTNFIKQLNNSTIQKWNVKKPKGKAAVTIAVDYFDSYGRKQDVIKFYKYSNREYAVVWGDYPVNTVSVTWLNQMLENAKQL